MLGTVYSQNEDKREVIAGLLSELSECSEVGLGTGKTKRGLKISIKTAKEIFGAGTAAVVNPIVGYSYKEEYYELPKIENSYAEQLKSKLTNMQHKLEADPFGWTVKI